MNLPESYTRGMYPLLNSQNIGAKAMTAIYHVLFNRMHYHMYW